jgi:hypothetical protein
MILTIVILLIVLWLLGITVHVGGALINLLLVIALIVFIVNMLQNRRSGV